MTEMLPLLEVGLATGAGRENNWEKGWTCPGTRKSQDPKGRDKYLARLTWKGEPTWIVKFVLDQESARRQFTWRLLGWLIAAQYGQSPAAATEDLLQALSVVLQRANARAVLRRMPDAGLSPGRLADP